MDPVYTRLTGGLSSLTMRRISESGDFDLQTNAKIEPSTQTHPATGIYMQVNFHHQLKDLNEGYGAHAAGSILQRDFQNPLSEADEIINTIMRIR